MPKHVHVQMAALTGDRELLERLCNELQMNPSQVSRLARVLHGRLWGERRKETFHIKEFEYGGKRLLRLGRADCFDIDHINRLRSKRKKNTPRVMMDALHYLAKALAVPTKDIRFDPRRNLR